MKKTNEVLNKLSNLKLEWDRNTKRISEIKEELIPVVIERFKQLGYKEEEFEERVKVAPRKFEKKKVIRGFISWNEDFVDEYTGNVTSIERHQIVMEDGEWYTGVVDLETLINWNR